MPPAVDWTDRARAALGRYAEPLLRDVAARLVKPRAAIPADELADKCLATLANPPVVDRRIRELPEAARKLLAVVGLSRRPTWRAGHLVAVSAALGHPDGLAPVFTLLEQGFLFPDLPADAPADVVAFDTWAGWAGTLHAPVFALPAVAARARAEDLGLPVPPDPDDEPNGATAPHRADGLDWPLRLGAAWQLVAGGPVRLTQANTLFKRDLGRLQADEVLTAAPPDQLAAVPDPGVLALFWAAGCGLLAAADGELRVAPFPESWGTQLAPVQADLLAGLTAVEAWDPLHGYAPTDTGVSPFPTAALLSLLLLAKVPPGRWVDPQAVADWLWEHHPSWGGAMPKAATAARGRAWAEAFLLGVGFPLGLVEAAKSGRGRGGDRGRGKPGLLTDTDTDTGTFLVRLTPLGQHLLAGKPEPPPAPTFPQTLVVQPNGEILAWRQGLTPALIGKLSRFARWKGVGPACTLELTADHTYRGLESGLTLAGMLQTLAQHGTKAVPPAVQDLLRRWADKRERIGVFASATLVEFRTAAELDEAISRGVVAVKVTDRIGMTDDGRDPDFQHLRLVGNRDFDTRPTRCVAVGDDGLTLTVDPANSDLLLEAEIGKLADGVPGDPPGVRRYVLTPGTLRRAVAGGMGLAELDAWFTARTGAPLSPAGRLFVTAPGTEPPPAERLLVVRLPSADVGDGLMQWPATAPLIADRLGPTAVAVAEEDLPKLRDVLAGIGVTLAGPG